MKTSLLKNSLLGIIPLLGLNFTVINSLSTEENKPKKPTLAVVLCDASGTVTRPGANNSINSFSSVIRHVNSLVLNYYSTGSTIIFLPISRVRHANILEEIHLKNVSKARKKKEEEERIASLDRLKKKLILFSKNEPKHTCILTSIENAYDIFRLKAQDDKYSSNNVDYELVILSDLIEDCRDSPIGEVNMEKNIEVSLRQIEKITTEVNLDALSIHVKPVITAQFTSAQFEQKSRQFWRTAFQKMRYKSASQMFFPPDI